MIVQQLEWQGAGEWWQVYLLGAGVQIGVGIK